MIGENVKSGVGYRTEYVEETTPLVFRLYHSQMRRRDFLVYMNSQRSQNLCTLLALSESPTMIDAKAYLSHRNRPEK